METKKEIHQLTDKNLLTFILAGNATFTVTNESSGNRFTYRIRKAGYGTATFKDTDVFYVSVLTGSDNTSSYQYLGTFFSGTSKTYVHSTKSKISISADSNKVLTWFFNHFVKNTTKYPTVKVYHAGKCGKCGRKLTTPESVETGLGPHCGNRS